jgi:hypothetical protein
MAYEKQNIAPGQTISSAWGNQVQTQYDEAIVDLKSMIGFKTWKIAKDANGIFTTVDFYRDDNNKLFMQSILSGGTSPLYTTRTIKWYGEDGTTVIATSVRNLTYDGDGDLIGEVV